MVGQGTAGRFEVARRRGYQGRVGDCQHGALTATARDGSGPNEDRAGH